jgi:hypothetical protein
MEMLVVEEVEQELTTGKATLHEIGKVMEFAE